MFLLAVLACRAKYTHLYCFKRIGLLSMRKANNMRSTLSFHYCTPVNTCYYLFVTIFQKYESSHIFYIHRIEMLTRYCNS